MVEDIKSPDLATYEVGQRILCDGQYGTICYVGPVDDTSGTWLGIDWDNPTRGKHNGTHNGKEYFRTRHPTSGSFVRPGKVKTGISCVEAIQNRYGYIDDELAGVDRENISKLRKEINAPFLEMVGFSKVNRKQSNFVELRIVSLREECVSHLGAPGSLQELCPNIEELDLSRNLINSWKTVADIASQLKKLDRLNISENVLPTNDALNRINDAFLHVTELTLAHQNYSWKDIEICTQMFPSLKILSVPFNSINSLEPPASSSPLQNLHTLTLEDNSITSWDEILKLSHLECLEDLNLSGNKIDRITLENNSFPALKHLHLSNNLISDWNSISELDKLANLEDLKFRDNPVLQAFSPGTARQVIIARIGRLRMLNATEISAQERREAEYDYMKLYAKDWLSLPVDGCDNSREKFLLNHPRYPALVEKYGGPEIMKTGTNEMKSDVITVEFVCMNDSPPPAKCFKRKVMSEMDVQKLVGMAQRLFKTGGRIPTLTFVESTSSKEIPLDKPLQQLSYYSVADGDRVLVRW